MPSTPIKESIVMEVGSLVMTSRDIHTVPMDDSLYPNGRGTRAIAKGTVGIILERPGVARERQFLINFVGGHQWWMYHNEIEPYFGEKNV
jgi:hypothetical protein